MLQIKRCLKISFKGEEVFIICEPGNGYEEIISQACARYNIPETQRAGVVLTNGQGYVFEQQLLEYFLLLFPSPEQVFYLRLDWQKLRRAVVEPVKQRRATNDGKPEERQKRQPSSSANESEYVAVPVHRQNCFIGALPTNQTATAAVLHVQQQQPQQSQQQTSVLRRLRPEEAAAAAAARSRLQAKRIRFQVYNKPRRAAAPTAAAPAQMALLTTAPRSIRI